MSQQKGIWIPPAATILPHFYEIMAIEMGDYAMSYQLRNGKLIKRERLRRREPVREPIKTKYYRELWMDGPVRKEARRLARLDLRKEYEAKGGDFDSLSFTETNNAVTLLLFNSEDVYLQRAKHSLGR